MRYSSLVISLCLFLSLSAPGAHHVCLKSMIRAARSVAARNFDVDRMDSYGLEQAIDSVEGTYCDEEELIGIKLCRNAQKARRIIHSSNPLRYPYLFVSGDSRIEGVLINLNNRLGLEEEKRQKEKSRLRVLGGTLFFLPLFVGPVVDAYSGGQTLGAFLTEAASALLGVGVMVSSLDFFKRQTDFSDYIKEVFDQMHAGGEAEKNILSFYAVHGIFGEVAIHYIYSDKEQHLLILPH